MRGRKTGEWRTTPVNLLIVEDDRYLVARGGGPVGVQPRGRWIEAFRVAALEDEMKAPILRGYLRRWKFEVGMFFDGLDVDTTDAKLAAIAPAFPVFRVTAQPEVALAGVADPSSGKKAEPCP